MSDLEWFADDFKLARDFSMAVMPLVYNIESKKEMIRQLMSEEEKVKQEILDPTYKENQLAIIAHTIKVLQEENSEAYAKLQEVKETFLAEDIVGALETLTSADSGMEISDATCELMKRVNDLLRQAGMGKY